jgi:hypothetical protein
MLDERRFLRGMAALCELYGAKPLGELAMDLYFKALAPFSDAQVEDAMVQAVSRCKWFPRPADLIEIINGGKDCVASRALVS